MRLLALALTLVAALPAAAQVFRPTTATLPNGLTVVVIETFRAPAVQHMLWYKVGSADEPPGKSGIAHYLEHLMFKGTGTVPSGGFSRRVAREGGRDNAFTSFDFTGYIQTMPADQLGLVMQMEADRMVNLRVPPHEAPPELAVVLEERRQRVDSQPGSQLSEHVQAVLYQHHPYRIPIIGWEHEIRALTLDDAMAFYRTWYAPNNAVLVVAGAVDAATVLRLAEQHYGPIPARAVPERVRLKEPPRLAGARVEYAHPRVRQTSLSLNWLVPADITRPESHALEVLESILSSPTAWLTKSLVLDREIATGAGASHDGSRLDQGQFSVRLTTRPEVSVATAEAALRAELTRLLADGVSEEDLTRAKWRLTSAAVYARDSLGGGARAFGSALTSGGTIADVEGWPAAIDAVTADAVLAAARRVIHLDRAVVAVLKPQS